MGLSVTLVTFSPNTPIKSADMNANFQQLLSAATFTGSQGSINTPTVLECIEDIDITIKNGSHTCHTSRHRHTNGSSDRCMSLSVKQSNVVIDALIIDETGQCHHKHGHHCDPHGNHYHSCCHFSGSGSGAYSHGLIGAVPIFILITPAGGTPANCSVTSINGSTCQVNLSAAVAFDGLAVYYSDVD